MFWLLIVLLTACHAVAAEDRARQVVVVYNERDPESRPLAEYYALRRGIPTNQLCAIQARPAETITRREFNEEVREPILRFLIGNGLLSQRARVENGKPMIETVASRVSYLALIYGVPLRIERDPTIQEAGYTKGARPEMTRNEASVDSELASLPVHGLPIAGPLRNPFLNSKVSFALPMNHRMFLVGRLDGPDAPAVRRMIDDALWVERHGLHGRAYFDARGTQEKGYIEGDAWIKGAHEALCAAGYECELDEREELYDEQYPMTDVAVYAGWYASNLTGPFLRPDFRFRPGALAYHIHSTSAHSVRTQVAAWVGPLLLKGAAASMGCVFEPYLALTPQVDVFFKRLLEGWTLLESGYAASPSLSWQTVFVGDPLYRPFAASLDEQIAALQADNRPELEWAWLRKVNLAARDEALKLCRAKAEELRSAVLHEKLGDLLGAGPAVRAYEQALQHTADTFTRVRVTDKLVNALLADKQPAAALARQETQLLNLANPVVAIRFYTKARDLARAAGDPDKVRHYQAKLEELNRPPRQNRLRNDCVIGRAAALLVRPVRAKLPGISERVFIGQSTTAPSAIPVSRGRPRGRATPLPACRRG